MSLAFMDVLEKRVAFLEHDRGVRAIVVTGAGDDNFSVGMDLRELSRGIQQKGGIDALLDQRLKVLSAIENMGKPWIATLFGYCLGGGLELPLGCHFRLAAAEGAQIGLPELDLGTEPAWGGSARLVRRVGRDRAIDMILRATKITGPEALRIGLASEVWPNAELKERAAALGDELASKPRLGVKAMLRCLVGSETKRLVESLRDEQDAVDATLGSPDQLEGINAFLEKRKPVSTVAKGAGGDSSPLVRGTRLVGPRFDKNSNSPLNSQNVGAIAPGSAHPFATTEAHQSARRAHRSLRGAAFNRQRGDRPFRIQYGAARRDAHRSLHCSSRRTGRRTGPSRPPEEEEKHNRMAARGARCFGAGARGDRRAIGSTGWARSFGCWSSPS
jgi:enoyl-CoA hydratase